MKTKEEILTAIRTCAKKLGRSPSLRELRQVSGINHTRLSKEFGGLNKALAAAGLDAVGSGFETAESSLLLDWATVVRKLGKVPTAQAYDKAGKYSLGPFYTRYERWGTVMETFKKFAAAEKIAAQWKDVLRLIGEREALAQRVKANGGKRHCPLLRDRPVYGDPLMMPEMAHEPTNEAGVVFAFGVLARRLGFVVLRVQTEFPDCEAVRRMAKGQWQRVRIEFEFESRSFVKHKHDPKGCDVIVCWTHNWAECPRSIEVVELRTEIQGLQQKVGETLASVR